MSDNCLCFLNWNKCFSLLILWFKTPIVTPPPPRFSLSQLFISSSSASLSFPSQHPCTLFSHTHFHFPRCVYWNSLPVFYAPLSCLSLCSYSVHVSGWVDSLKVFTLGANVSDTLNHLFLIFSPSLHCSLVSFPCQCSTFLTCFLAPFLFCFGCESLSWFHSHRAIGLKG